jgi:hypothetical protein
MAKQRKKGIPAWAFVAAGLAAVAILAVNVGRKIYVKSMRVQIPKIDFAKVTLRLIVQVVNNSGVGVPIDAVTGTLRYGNDPISAVNLPVGLTIKANQTTDLALDLIIPFENLGEQLIKLVKNGTWYRGLYFDGHVVSKGILIPIKNFNIQVL